MSDLVQAVRAEIDAWAPRAAPPAFDALAGRKRARDRRRLATGGAVLSAVAIAGVVALTPSLGGGQDRLPTIGASSAPTPAAPGARVPPASPADAELCKDTGSSSQCYSVGPDQARRLAAALATGRPRQPGAAECLATPVAVYRARFMPAAGVIDPLVWEVPSGLCLPMTAGGRTYDLPDDAQADVAGIWDTAGLVPVDEVTTGRRTPSPPRG